jgi:molybdenum cofactor synthesis domain-containing protein
MLRDMTIERVAILVVGDEILSGDTPEANAGFMARALFEQGVTLGRIVVVPDRPDEIAAQVAGLAEEFDVVITCGGIGPTHDDITMESIAQAFDVPLIDHPDLVALLHKWKGDDLDDSHRRLARVPAPTVLHWYDDSFPLLQVNNVYVLPGVPRLLRQKFANLLPRLAGEPLHQRQFTVTQNELSFANALRAIQDRSPTVSVGSYPYSTAPGKWGVRLVLKAHDKAALDRACEDLQSHLDNPQELDLTEAEPEPDRL